MNINNTPIKDVPTGALLCKLAEGWRTSHIGLAQELVHRWTSILSASADIRATSQDTLSFVATINGVYLRNMQNIPCLLVSGKSDVTNEINQFTQKNYGPYYLPFIIALSDSAYEQVEGCARKVLCLKLSPQQVGCLFTSTNPQQLLKELLRQQIPIRRLNPYNLLTPADGVLFFGRQHELGRLKDEDSISFAIAGPGRIGKTSLVMRYRNEIIRRRDPQCSRMFYVNFYGCKDTTPNTVARFLAMEIECTRRSSTMTFHGLVNFFRYKYKTLGGPLVLLLDEVDEICESEVFSALGEAARMGLCRLILCGRGVLLKSMLSMNSAIGFRLNLIQLEPLDRSSAAALILQPLQDLGFKISEPDSFVEKILLLTGQLPHLVQFFGGRLVESAIVHNTEVVSVKSIEILKSDFLTAQFFIQPLNGIEDPEARLVALVLLKNRAMKFDPKYVIAEAARVGLLLDYRRTIDICNDLVINNVLAWSGNTYCLANEGIYFYAHEMNYLDNAIKELVRKM